MTAQRPLFDKTMTELREAFVRNRFAQEGVFGKPDIVEWLGTEYQADRPEYHSGFSYWNQVLSLDALLNAAMGNEQALLRECATRMCPVHVSMDEEEFISLFAQFKTSAELYRGRNGSVLLPPHASGAPEEELFSLRTEPAGTGSQLVVRRRGQSPLHVSIDTADAIFTEWIVRRPRWRAARQWLCDRLSTEITKERARAEKDFDAAVAVSADGTKIALADWVVVRIEADSVAQTKERLVAIPAAEFRVKKARRCDGERRGGVVDLRELQDRVAAADALQPSAVLAAACVAMDRVSDGLREMWPYQCFLGIKAADRMVPTLVVREGDCDPSLLHGMGQRVTMELIKRGW
ncbi:hypothetical protein HY632_01450 [Candidatus Uhrbacteria bacterium]|nr:hypothetical protein [Candidatus Uhrbacteria bacterium]